MVIGTVGLRKLSGLLSGLGEPLGREINPHALTPEERAERLTEKDHFVTSLMNGERRFVVGSADELIAFARELQLNVLVWLRSTHPEFERKAKLRAA